MDFELLFHQYKEEFLIENAKLENAKKVYNTIYEKILYLNWAIMKNIFLTSKEIYFLNLKFYLSELLQFFARFYQFSPHHNRFLFALQEKSILLEEYLEIKSRLEKLLLTYKEMGQDDVFHFSVIEAFIEITMDTYIQEMKENNMYLNDMKKCLVNGEKPILKNFPLVHELKTFILKEQNNYEGLTSIEFRRNLAKKE